MQVPSSERWKSLEATGVIHCIKVLYLTSSAVGGSVGVDGRVTESPRSVFPARHPGKCSCRQAFLVETNRASTDFRSLFRRLIGDRGGEHDHQGSHLGLSSGVVGTGSPQILRRRYAAIL